MKGVSEYQDITFLKQDLGGCRQEHEQRAFPAWPLKPEGPAMAPILRNFRMTRRDHDCEKHSSILYW